jgi:serine-type D-Ala-D-Ala carboxypeptidase (penicillin-binding protein 5/6)
MKSYQLGLLFLLIAFFPLLPQFSKTLPTIKPKVKSASIHLPQVIKNNHQPTPVVSAKAVHILDLSSNTTLYNHQSALPLYPASLTKIMTALISLESYQLDQILTVKSADQSIGHTMNLQPGDRLTVIDLLNGLLIASGNDAALALAENFEGGYSQFITAMNQKAQSLGLKHTHFNNVSGIEDQSHLSTAEDLTKLTQAALKHPPFRQIVERASFKVSSLNGHNYSLQSTNQLLGQLPGVKGVKTGWTPEAGECLITLIDQDSHPILITILGSEDRFQDTRDLVNWVYQNFTWEQRTFTPATQQ